MGDSWERVWAAFLRKGPYIVLGVVGQCPAALLCGSQKAAVDSTDMTRVTVLPRNVRSWAGPAVSSWPQLKQREAVSVNTS